MSAILRPIDRYTQQRQRQVLMTKIAAAARLAIRYADHDAAQAKLWLDEADKGRADLRALSDA